MISIEEDKFCNEAFLPGFKDETWGTHVGFVDSPLAQGWGTEFVVFGRLSSQATSADSSAWAKGINTSKVLPFPGSLVTLMRPWCSSTMR